MKRRELFSMSKPATETDSPTVFSVTKGMTRNRKGDRSTSKKLPSSVGDPGIHWECLAGITMGPEAD